MYCGIVSTPYLDREVEGFSAQLRAGKSFTRRSTNRGDSNSLD